jgi:hypothetical protein
VGPEGGQEYVRAFAVARARAESSALRSEALHAECRAACSAEQVNARRILARHRNEPPVSDPGC